MTFGLSTDLAGGLWPERGSRATVCSSGRSLRVYSEGYSC